MSNKFDEAISNVSNISAKYNDMVAQFQKNMMKTLREVFVGFFDISPEVEYVAWPQYTPHFNDGDACVFQVHDLGFALVNDFPKDGDDDDDDDSFIDIVYDLPYRYDLKWNRDETLKIISSLNISEARLAEIIENFTVMQRALHTLGDDIFKAAFGDHVIVKATRTGFTVSEFEHD